MGPVLEDVAPPFRTNEHMHVAPDQEIPFVLLMSSGSILLCGVLLSGCQKAGKKCQYLKFV